jgi:hypothetical protein
MTHYFKTFNWLLDCSLKQPPWRLGAMKSPIKVSGILVPNKVLLAIYYCVLLDWFLNFSLK